MDSTAECKKLQSEEHRNNVRRKRARKGEASKRGRCRCSVVQLEMGDLQAIVWL